MAAASSIVGSRELKTRLGTYLNRVRLGETLLVTDRDEPVAELRPVVMTRDPVAAALRKLAADGIVTLPARKRGAAFTSIRSRGASASAALSSDREDRQ
jgi:antitoxin (DNA-binding transcriptional repressor) of toxin-antitoxin stability system